MRPHTVVILFISFFILSLNKISAQGFNTEKEDSVSLPREVQLKEVTVQGNSISIKLRTQPLSTNTVNSDYLRINNHSSLMKSLEKLPGITAMEIGQGFSKPVIRGLAFNRVAVLENGIKQQGQQWGADHGLEIDQFNVENIEIVKGPSSLLYGSDAIGGVILIQPTLFQEKDGLTGTILLNGKSNNSLFGGSSSINYQKNKKFIRGRLSYQNYGDYHVPAESFNYLGWTFPLQNGNLKNTAGRETDIHLQAGLEVNKVTSSLSFSNVYAKNGFFAGAHGIPTQVSMNDDGNHRNIDMPYQKVNHMKVISNTQIKLDKRQKLSIDAGYQQNLRQEYSLPHTHGTGPKPEGNLELEFKLHTTTLNSTWEFRNSTKNTLYAGINTEFQHNKIGGYSFLLPAYEQFIPGIFISDRYRISDQLVLTSGLRYDYGYLHIHQYIDPTLPSKYSQLSPNLKKNMGDISLGAGIAYQVTSSTNLKLNIGKSFRMPTANELASNGVHHGSFRFEKGDSTLVPETSYQIDFGLDFLTEKTRLFDSFSFSINGFGSYFPNFIFLNPTGEYNELNDVGQIYQYIQDKALRFGGEAQLKMDFCPLLSWESSAEYVYAKDLDTDYPIPFTPPFSLINDLSFRLNKIGPVTNNSFTFTHRYYAAQNRVARNEETTPAAHVFDFSTAFHIPYNKKRQAIQLVFQIQNLLDKAYYNHISFYRHLDIPEIGRNFTLSLSVKI